MRSLARTSLGLLGLALIAPSGVQAQDPSNMPSGYRPMAPSASAASTDGATYAPAPVATDAQRVATPAPEAPHKHKGRTICAKCAAKLQAANGLPPGGKIVGCMHSKNGVCPACQAALNAPGSFVTSGGPWTVETAAQPGMAPGRAVASSSPNPAGYSARTSLAGYEPGLEEPAPVGVVQANFSQGGPMGSPASFAPQMAGAPSGSASAPGHAVVESSAGRDPYQAKSGPFPRPHILGHLFGWSGLGAESAEARAWKKAEAHASLRYDENSTAPVEEIPASMVFGKKSPR